MLHSPLALFLELGYIFDVILDRFGDAFEFLEGLLVLCAHSNGINIITSDAVRFLFKTQSLDGYLD